METVSFIINKNQTPRLLYTQVPRSHRGGEGKIAGLPQGGQEIGKIGEHGTR